MNKQAIDALLQKINDSAPVKAIRARSRSSTASSQDLFYTIEDLDVQPDEFWTR